MTEAARKLDRPRFAGVRPPKPLLPAATERRLTPRQRKLLDDLEAMLVKEQLADLTMAEIAAKVSCSLRTLYGIARTKHELILAVFDRRLHRIGRAAVEELDAEMSPLEALRRYQRSVNEAVQPATTTFARDFAQLPGAARLLTAHRSYIRGVAHSLLDRAVEEGEIAAADTAAVAHVLSTLGWEFSRLEEQGTVRGSPAEAANEITEIILRGLMPRGGAPQP